MKQTAVDWLVDQIENYNCMKLGLIPSDIIEKAKRMEKEQIIQAASTVLWNNNSNSNEVAEQYYNETYE